MLFKFAMKNEQKKPFKTNFFFFKRSILPCICPGPVPYRIPAAVPKLPAQAFVRPDSDQPLTEILQ
jgi:hypothetical protein